MYQNFFPVSFLILWRLSEKLWARPTTHLIRGIHKIAFVLSSYEFCNVNRSIDHESDLTMLGPLPMFSTPKTWTTSLALTKVQIIPCAQEKPVLADSWWIGLQHIILLCVQLKSTKRAWTWVEMKCSVQYSGSNVSSHMCFWLWPAMTHGCMLACKQCEQLANPGCKYLNELVTTAITFMMKNYINHRPLPISYCVIQDWYNGALYLGLSSEPSKACVT